ncbi:MAG: prolyl oligopeptidase family serine peptidase [Aliidongia sp.]
MLISIRLLIAAALVAGPVFSATAADHVPPTAAVEPVVDDYFGTKITDDYRWMEDRAAPRFVAWAKDENAYARAMLDRIPGREDLQARVAAHTAGGASVTRVRLAQGKVFYLKRVPGENSYKLYVRDRVDGPERILFDPDTIPTDGPHYAIDYFEPSMDGGRVAFGISPGGSENSVIHILDVTTGRQSPETIDRAEDGNPNWLPDGTGFFYNRFALLGPGAKETDKYLNSRALLHRVGTDPAKDTPLIGTSVAGSPNVTAVDMPDVQTANGSAYAVATISHGADPNVTLYIAPLKQVVSGRPHWRKLADVGDAVAGAVLHGDEVFLLSHKAAPRYQVLATKAAAGDAAHAKLVIPTGERVVQDIAVASDALYIRDLDAGLNHIRRLDFATGKLTELALPASGAVSGPITDPASPEMLFGMQGWVLAPAIYRSHGTTVTRTDLVPPWQDDLSPYESKELLATAPDGTKIPLSIVARKGLAATGDHPIWLTGYGAYGIALEPALVSRFLAFLDDGGIYAVAHVRGGGEFGEDWHQAGRIATKPNSHQDLIACAEYLVAAGYGKADTLAIEGRSAGGITVGMALTARPDLFRVVFSGVGDSNPLRSENGTDGPANSLEYGSVATEAGFKALYAVDATQHVVQGTPYPAVLLTTGMNDPRVAPWQPGKMAAHLQAATSSGRPVLLLVDFDAGHGMGSTKQQRDREIADQMAFLYWQIGRPGFQPAE